jgi:hypothetical protein
MGEAPVHVDKHRNPYGFWKRPAHVKRGAVRDIKEQGKDAPLIMLFHVDV